MSRRVADVASLGDDGIPFVLVGPVTSWDPITRVLWVGGQRLHVPPSVPVQLLTDQLSVTIVGHRPRAGAEPWSVTEIRRHEPGF